MAENRQEIWKEYTGPKNKNIQRMFLDYDRYHEASLIHTDLQTILEALEQKWSDLFVLDYGCGVADYGIYFGRLGAKVAIYDIDEEALLFAAWRFKREKLKAGKDITAKYAMVIFGEVLDHLDDPENVLQSFIEDGVQYLFTSSYPYRSDDPNNEHWSHDHHPKSAFEQQAACRKLLEKNYDCMQYEGEKRLWVRKG